MEQNFPMSIKSEKDLVLYEKYLKNDSIMNTTNFENYLINNRGKLVKVESLICGRLQSRVGILMEVGEDHIIIKPARACVTTAIKIEDIKYITVIHDNDRKKAMLH